jgi:hypothetical protein
VLLKNSKKPIAVKTNHDLRHDFSKLVKSADLESVSKPDLSLGEVFAGYWESRAATAHYFLPHLPMSIIFFVR